jgi:hypothetical protein
MMVQDDGGDVAALTFVPCSALAPSQRLQPERLQSAKRELPLSNFPLMTEPAFEKQFNVLAVFLQPSPQHRSIHLVRRHPRVAFPFSCRRRSLDAARTLGIAG